jgi:hypothetical protein
MEESPSWEADSSSASWEVLHILWKMKVHYWSRGSIVGIATMLQAGQCGVWILVGAKDFSLLQKRPERLWGPPSLPFNGYRGSFLRVKQLECEFNQSPSSSAEVKNEWSYTSTSLSFWRFITVFTTVHNFSCSELDESNPHSLTLLWDTF